MNKKKLLISLVIAGLLIAVAGFFIWRDVKSVKDGSVFEGKNNENKNENIDVSVGTNNEGAIVKILSSGEIKPLEINMPDLSKPIIIKGDFSVDIKNAFYKKIQEQIDLLKKDSNNVDNWIVLGNYRKMAEDYEGAAEAWNYAAALNPQNTIPFYNLGYLYGFYLKDLAKAETNYLKSIQNDPQNFQAYIDLADLYWADNKGVKQERIEGLLKKGIEAVSGVNKNAIILRLAGYYESIKDFGNAGIYYDMLLKAEPDNAEIQQKMIELQRQ
jgi:tetratricopeptide (TPR) repeat protein